MAQDFAATFGLGDDDRSINGVDVNGVLTVAVQALARRVDDLEAELARVADQPRTIAFSPPI